MKKKRMIIVGAGGHAKVVLDAALEAGFSVEGFIDNCENDIDIAGVSLIGCDDDLKKIYDSGITNAVIGVGHVGNAKIRVRLYEQLKQIGFDMPNVIHPAATVSKVAQLGEGNVVLAGAVVNACANIGNNCIINTRTVVEHDTVIGNHVHLAPGAIVLGGASVGEESFVGAGSVVIQGGCVGEKCIVGANSAVLTDILDKQTVVGSPAKDIRGR